GRDVDTLRCPHQIAAHWADYTVIRGAEAAELPNKHGAFYSVRLALRVHALRTQVHVSSLVVRLGVTQRYVAVYPKEVFKANQALYV
ncbi:MAG TPA: hypothetical protein VNV63_02200, partial [Nitrospiria bacterium]|nr:hypothetical protein [Nitrospiria bacterium]